MYSGTTVFSQLMQQLPWRRFQTFVDRYQGDYKVKTFRCTEHFRVMAFAQLTYRESLRDIEACLRAMEPKLYHVGIHSSVSRNNLSNANENRDWRIYAEFAQFLIQDARELYANDSTFPALDATVYALDSTTIDLCMTLFPWALYSFEPGTGRPVRFARRIIIRLSMEQLFWIYTSIKTTGVALCSTHAGQFELRR